MENGNQLYPKPEYVYVASSWRNETHPLVVEILRSAGISCYDFKRDEGAQFNWAETDPEWRTNWNGRVDEFLGMLVHPRARQGFKSDYGAMLRADAFVLVHPAGRSAHLELGWAVGAGRRTAIYIPDGLDEPDLMYSMVDLVTDNILDLLTWLGVED